MCCWWWPCWWLPMVTLIRGWWLYRVGGCCCICACWWIAADWLLLMVCDWMGAVAVAATAAVDVLRLTLLLCDRKSTDGYRWIGVTIDLPPMRRGWCPNPIPVPPDNEADTRARPKPQDCERLSIQKCMPLVEWGVAGRSQCLVNQMKQIKIFNTLKCINKL